MIENIYCEQWLVLTDYDIIIRFPYLYDYQESRIYLDEYNQAS